MLDFLNQCQRILNDYEAHGRDAQRVLEVISCLVKDLQEEGELGREAGRILRVIKEWEEGAWPDDDALETIAGLARLG